MEELYKGISVCCFKGDTDEIVGIQILNIKVNKMILNQSF